MLDILKIWCHFESVLRLFWGYLRSLRSFKVNYVIWGHLNYVLWPLRSYEVIESHWNHFWPLSSFKTSVHNLLGHPVDRKTLYFVACFFTFLDDDHCCPQHDFYWLVCNVILLWKNFWLQFVFEATVRYIVYCRRGLVGISTSSWCTHFILVLSGGQQAAARRKTSLFEAPLLAMQQTFHSYVVPFH